MIYNRETFFSGYRTSFTSLVQSEVDGLNFLLDKLEQDTFTLKQQAYVLATIHHETGAKFQPIKEIRERSTSPRRANQDRYWLTGYYGRSFVQITWKKNYEKFGIADDPDKALEPETAYEIAARGMREGLFTSKKLSDFINGQADYRNARKVINGLDKADLIAGHARKYEAILIAAQSQTAPQVRPPDPGGPTVKPEAPASIPHPPAAPQSPKPSVTPISPPSTSIITKVAAAASAITPVLTATGMKIGGVEFKTGGIIAFSAIVIVGMVVAAYLWNSAQNRRHEELKLSMANLASPEKANIIAAGSQV